MSETLDKAFSPARLGKLELKNHIIKAATYESKTPGELLLDFHKAVVEGGTAMIEWNPMTMPYFDGWSSWSSPLTSRNWFMSSSCLTSHRRAL